MTQFYLLKNQHNQFLDRSGTWVDSQTESSLFKTIHKDEAINQKVELIVKNPELRIFVESAVSEEDGKIAFYSKKLECDELSPSNV